MINTPTTVEEAKQKIIESFAEDYIQDALVVLMGTAYMSQPVFVFPTSESQFREQISKMFPDFEQHADNTAVPANVALKLMKQALAMVPDNFFDV